MKSDDTPVPVEELGLMTNLVSRPKPVRRSMPTAMAYDLQAIQTPKRLPAAKALVQKVSESSMFFRFRGGALDRDPFLQRLSRLN